MPDKPMLVINTNSWHFRYYQRLRGFYGCQTTTDKVTSLCPYCQTMIWGSVLFVATLPLQIFGWLVVKSGRFLYKMAETAGWNKVVDLIDKTLVSDFLDLDDEIIDKPWLALVSRGIVAVTAIIILAVTIGLGAILIFHGIMLLPSFPAFLWSVLIGCLSAVLFFGWGMVITGHGLTMAVIISVAAIWWCLSQAGLGIAWFFTASWLWLAVLYFAGWVGLVVGGGFLISLTTIQCVTSQWFKRILSFLVMKFNGFHEARDAAFKRRTAEAKAQRDQGMVKQYVPFDETRLGSVLMSFYHKLSYPFKRLFSYEINTAGVQKKVMGPLSLVWSFFWAVKHQMCPMVSFVDVEEELAQADDPTNTGGPE